MLNEPLACLVGPGLMTGDPGEGRVFYRMERPVAADVGRPRRRRPVVETPPSLASRPGRTGLDHTCMISADAAAGAHYFDRPQSELSTSQ